MAILVVEFQVREYKIRYHTRAIITRGLHILNPFLKVKNIFLGFFFSENTAFKYGLYSRAVSNQEPVMMVRIQ